MFGPIHTLIFDFDGTLVDTMPSVIQGLHEAATLGSGKTITIEELVMTFGGAPLDVLRRWVPEENLQESFAHWINFEKNAKPQDFRPFDGVVEMLDEIQSRSLKMGVFTGRDREGTLRILEANKWLGKYFTEKTIVCGDDGLPPKPKPDLLIHLLGKLEREAKTTLMVGDHPYDMIAGKAAGTKTAAALWDLPKGKKSPRLAFRENWKKWDGVPCDLRLEKPGSLVEWLKTAP